MRDARFHKVLVSVAALTPLVMLAWDAWRGLLGANPIEFIIRTTGVLTLVFLLITLAITPARRFFKLNELIRIRRMTALWSFFFACFHFSVYLFFDQEMNVLAMAKDVWERPFVAIGMSAFILMVPLALTSTNAMVRRLGGKRWARLHRLTYLIGLLGVIHFWMIVKSDVFYPAMFGIILFILLALRVVRRRAKAPVRAS